MIRMAEEQSDDSPAVFVFHFALIFFCKRSIYGHNSQ